jgi:ectoine hydroxylase-related dioxygenase (phytanoyl-CoA dioxygenase family)
MSTMTIDHAELVREYQERGFAVVRGALDPAELEPVRGVIARAIDDLARGMVARGEAANTFAGEPIETRLVKLLAGREFGRSWDEPLYGPELHALLTHEAILSRLRPLLGEHILHDGHHRLRPKLPGSELTSFPYHQDSQYYGAETAHAHIITVWVPFIDVDEDNGCLWFIPGSHRWGLLGGERGADMNIRTYEDVEKRGKGIPLTMRRGDIVLFPNLTVHGSKVNRTPRVRWSIDLRYLSGVDPATRPEPERGSLQAYRAKISHGATLAVSGPSGAESWESWKTRRAAAQARA